MTITLSERDIVEHFQESIQPQAPAQAEVTRLLHQQFGVGCRHYIQLRDVDLLIHHYDLQDDLLVFRRQPVLPKCLEFGFRVSGNCSIHSAGQNFLLYGPRESGTRLLPQDEFWQVDIHLPSLEILSSFMQGKSVEASAIEQLFENSMERTYYEINSTNPGMQMALKQLLNCPYQGLTKQVYLESKCYELIALKLEQLTARDRDRSVQMPLPIKEEDVERIHQAKDILITHYDNPPSLMELARQVGINDHKLKKGFRQVFGTTVFGYLLQYRLEQARQLLQIGEMNVAEVAHQIGFADRSYFSKAFRKQFGLTPGTYRRSQRGTFYTN